MQMGNRQHRLTAAAARPADGFPTMTQFATLAAWLVCVTAGVLGMIWPEAPASPDSGKKAASPMTVTVSLASAEPAAPAPAAAAKLPPAAPAEAQVAMPAAPPAVAMPSPDIAFAVPTAGVAQLVPPALAMPPSAAPAQGRPASPAGFVHHLIVGQGEAQYIHLEYPEEARLDGEEGTVTVQFTRDRDGHVTEAHLSHPSRWTILNQSALRAVRKTAFPSGLPGQYDIVFQFTLR